MIIAVVKDGILDGIPDGTKAIMPLRAENHRQLLLHNWCQPQPHIKLRATLGMLVGMLVGTRAGMKAITNIWVKMLEQGNQIYWVLLQQ